MLTYTAFSLIFLGSTYRIILFLLNCPSSHNGFKGQTGVLNVKQWSNLDPNFVYISLHVALKVFQPILFYANQGGDHGKYSKKLEEAFRRALFFVRSQSNSNFDGGSLQFMMKLDF